MASDVGAVVEESPRQIKEKMIYFQASIYHVGNQRCVAVPRTIALQCGNERYIPVIAEIGNHRFESTLLPAKEGDLIGYRF
jgi:hypothetical protein